MNTDPNKAVLITGASSGIGRQLALDYAGDGYRVIGCGRNPQRLAALGAEAAQIEPLAFDIGDPEAVRQALSKLTAIPGLIILNAGDCEYINHGELDAALCQRVFASNFFGVVNMLEALQHRLPSPCHIGIMGSSATFLPLPRAEAYGASKAALQYFCQSLALDWAKRGVSFSLISPGFVKTPLTDKNDFAMPMRISAEEASRIIRQGLAKGRSSINFPRRFTGLMQAIALLPAAWRNQLIIKMTGSAS